MNSYKKLCTEFYDLDKPQPPKAALAFLLKHLAPANGPVLEPMSGSGRFLIPLLHLGFDVEGFDASPDMLRACRARCARENLQPVLYEGFLETIRLTRQYGGIFILAGSLGLITDPESVKVSMGRLFEWLAPSGKLIVEVETPAGQTGGLRAWNSRTVTRPDGARIVCRARGDYSPEERVNRIAIEYQLTRDGQLVAEESEELSIRHYDLTEFSGLLGEAGFSDIEPYAPYGPDRATADDNGAVLVCRKA